MPETESSISLAALSEKILFAAKRVGAESADSLVAYGSSTNVDVRNGALELAERSEGSDIGLRVFIGQKQAVMLGGLLLCLGHGILAVNAEWAFFSGLILIVIGVGFLKPNISTISGFFGRVPKLQNQLL